MPLSDDQFDTMIQTVIAGRPPVPAAAAGPHPHRVLWFAIGAGLFTIDACLLIDGARFTWMLLHL